MQAVLQDQDAARIADIVNGLLGKRGAASVVELSQNLREAGLTSLDMVNLMLAVEGAFDIFIPEEQMTPENFRNIDAIQALVAGLVTRD